MIGWLLLSLCAFTPAANAAEPNATVDLAVEADLQFNLGIAAYQAGQYAAALEHLLASNRLVPNKAVVFNIAKAFEQLGDFAQAYRYYAAYTDLETDAARKQAGAQALARIAPKVALVRITSDPPGAAVYVDREDLGARGVTPQTLALGPGAHTILLAQPGYAPASTNVEAVVGASVDARVALTQILGTVHIDGTPGAAVRLDREDGPILGGVPGDFSLPPGPHVLVVSAEGYATKRTIAEVTADATTRTVADLDLLTGTIVVNAFERDALIRIDGTAAGFTPAVLEVPAGPHQVSVSLDGFRTFSTDVTVAADQTDTVDARLQSLTEVTAASRTTQAVEDAPASVSVIPAEEVRAFGYQTVYDAVSGSRGIYQTNDLSYQALGVRGFGRLGDYGNRLLVTWDGHTLNDDQLGASYVGDDLTVDLHDVDRIEVVRGPGSALYGTNAFFGVINVVTRSGDARPGPHAVITGDANRTERARLGYGTGDDAHGAYFSAAQAASQGGDYHFDALETDHRDGDIDGSDGEDAATLHAKAWSGDLTVQAYYNARRKQFPTGAFDTVPGDPANRAEDHRGFAEVRYEPEIGDKAQFYGRAYVDHYRYYGDFPYRNDYLYSDRWVGVWTGVEPRLVLTPSALFTATVGAEARVHPVAALDSSDTDGAVLNDDRPTQQVFSGYGVVQLDPAHAVTLSVGGRYDHFSLAGVGTFNPRAAVILRPDSADVVKLMGGTAFRAPSPYELFYDDGGLTQVTPDTLAPERIRTVELEASHRFDDVTVLTGSLFYYAIPGLVDLVENADGLLVYANTDQTVQAAGGEYELRRDWRRGAMFAFQHSIARARDGDLLDGARLTNSPSHLFSLKAAAPLSAADTTVATRLRAGSPRLDTAGGETDWAVVWDVMLTGALPTVPVTWGLGVRNLLDWQEAHPGGLDVPMAQLPQPGRSVFATIEVHAVKHEDDP